MAQVLDTAKDSITAINDGVIHTFPDGTKITASVFGLEYAAYPNLRTEEVELEDGTVMFDGLELWLHSADETKKPTLLLNLNGLDAKTFQLARTINESSVENYDTTSLALGWIEDTIIEYESEKYSEADYQAMRDDEAGDRAYHAQF